MLTVDTRRPPFEQAQKLLSSVSTVHSQNSQSEQSHRPPIEGVMPLQILSPGMPKQSGSQIGHKVLAKLLDWLATLCWRYAIDDQGLYLTAELLKRTIRGSKPIDRSKLQGIGATCLLLSCKYTNQKKRFSLKEVTEICRGVYTSDEILEMQGAVLEAVQYNLELFHVHHQFEALLEGTPGMLSPSDKIRAAFLLEVKLLLHEDTGSFEQLRALTDIIEFVRNGSPSYLVRELIKCSLASNRKTVLHRHAQRFDAEGYLTQLQKDHSE